MFLGLFKWWFLHFILFFLITELINTMQVFTIIELQIFWKEKAISGEGSSMAKSIRFTKKKLNLQFSRIEQPVYSCIKC